MKQNQSNTCNKFLNNIKTSIFVLLMLATASSFAQNKDFDKLQKLYLTNQFDKCIEKAQEISSKYAQSPIPSYYISFSNFGKYIVAPQIQKKILLSATLNYLKNAVKRDKDSSQYLIFIAQIKQIHDTTKIFADKLWQTDQNTAGQFYKSLAEVFCDTTDQYRDLFIPKVQKNQQFLAFNENSGPVNQTDVAGNKQGVWISKYPTGIVKSEIFFKDNHPAGVFRKYYENGKLKSDMYFNEAGDRTSAILYDQEGSKIAMGYYNNKLKDSLWQYFYQDSILIAEENYKSGKKNGVERNYSTLGPVVLEEKFWKNDLLDSTWSRYSIDGKIKSIANYKNGVRTGKYQIFDDNGNPIIIGYYKNNLPQGTWNYWNDTTKKFIKIEYKDGVAKNLDKLTDDENKIFQQMDQMKGKLEEPSDYIKRVYENGGNE